MTGLPDEIHRLVQVAILMAQELQEVVGDAQESSGDENALKATQQLLDDWEEAFAEANVQPRWQDVLATGDGAELNI